MRVTMDRYNSDWGVVQRGWEAHVCGFPEKTPDYEGHFRTATEAVKKARELDPDISDQVLPSFVVVDERENPIFKEAVKIGLTPLISSLAIMDYAQTEEEVLGYGISLIILNLGMYIAAPAILIFKTRKLVKI